MGSNGGEYIYFDGVDDPACSQLNDAVEETDAPVFGKLPDGSWLQWDPRLALEKNTLDQHLEDGGGLTQSLTGGQTRCANAPRTFLNQDQCSLSFAPTACGSTGTPDLEIALDPDNIATLHDITGQYVYGLLGLPVIDFQGNALESPCTLGLRSRWEILNAADCPEPTVLGTETNATLVKLLTQSSDMNPSLRDIIFPSRGHSCSAEDYASLGEVEIVVESTCFKRVHPEHLSVYDMTYWSKSETWRYVSCLSTVLF